MGETAWSNSWFAKLKGRRAFVGAVGKEIELTRGSGGHPGWKVTRRGEPGAPNVVNSFTMMKKLKVVKKPTVTLTDHTFVNRGILVYEWMGHWGNEGNEVITRRAFLFINNVGQLVILHKVLVNGIGWVSETIAQRD